MKTLKTSLATFAIAALFASSVVLPRAAAVPAGADIYIFAGDDAGGRYAIKSNGDGTFGAVTKTFTKGDNNRGGAVEDFDNDGDLDFVGCDDNTDTCYLFKQGPAGTFVDQGNFPVGPLNFFEMGMAAADFNLDGNADVLFSGHTDFFRVLSGNGAGSFAILSTTFSPVIAGFRGKDTADVDGDGDPDVIAALAQGSGLGGEVYIFTNDGTGNFSPGVFALDTLGNSNDPHAVTAADFDGDGFIDIVAGGSSDGDVSLWTGDGAGNFTFFGQVFDFNGRTSTDDQDLVATTQSSKKVHYLAGNGDGTFQVPVVLGTMATFGMGMAAPPAPPIRSKVTGRVFNDANGNGVDDSEVGIELVEMELSGTDFLGNTVALMATSASDGSFSLTGVPIDDGNGYTLTVVSPPAGFTATTTEFRAVSIPKENTTVVEDFGYREVALAGTIQGIVFDDLDQDGVNDTEPGFSGVQITITGTDSDGSAVNEVTTTGADGSYSFDSVPASDNDGYTVQVTGATPATFATSPTSITLVLEPGETAVVDFGFSNTSPPSLDGDSDGVLNADDVCPNTVLANDQPSKKLLPNHLADIDGDGVLEVGTIQGFEDSEFSLSDTGGCNCTDIIQSMPGLNNGLVKFGCTPGTLEVHINSL